MDLNNICRKRKKCDTYEDIDPFHYNSILTDLCRLDVIIGSFVDEFVFHTRKYTDDGSERFSDGVNVLAELKKIFLSPNSEEQVMLLKHKRFIEIKLAKMLVNMSYVLVFCDDDDDTRDCLKFFLDVKHGLKDLMNMVERWRVEK